MQKNKKLILSFKQFFIGGFLLGVANIIPGISGGSLALILGFYDRLLQCIRRCTSELPAEFWRRKGAMLQSGAEIKRWFFKYDLFFASSIGVGAIAGILLFSKLLKQGLEQYPVYVFSLFFGFIFASIPIPWNEIQTKTTQHYLLFAVGVLSLFLIRLNSFHPSGDPSEITQFYVFISGFVGIMSMLLPGLSGSFVLIVMGTYHFILSAIAGFKIFPLMVFGLGCGVGFVVGAAFLNWALKRFRDQTMAFLCGLVAGSLFILWPFQSFEFVQIGDKERWMATSYILPQSLVDVLAFFVIAIVGGAAVFWMRHFRFNPEESSYEFH